MARTVPRQKKSELPGPTQACAEDGVLELETLLSGSALLG